MATLKVTRRAFMRFVALSGGAVLAACAKPTPAPTVAPTRPAVAPTTVAPTAAPTAAPRPTAVPSPVAPTAAAKAGAYKEAPMLADLVKAGKLPPVEQRLPKEPLVVKPLEKTGKYGGLLRTGFLQTSLWGFTCLRAQGLITYDLACSKFDLDMAKSIKWSPDAKVLTIELREGHRWSDGAPFTVDDILFWWEDVANNKDLTPAANKFWQPGGKPAEFKKISPTVLQIVFAVPYPVATDLLARARYSTDTQFMLPTHYLSKWHLKYNDKANDVAKAENQDSWTKAFRLHAFPGNNFEIGRPTLWAWIPDKSTAERALAVRNPYYHQVDSEGNQLPYIDQVECVVTNNREVHTLKTANGEFDFECYWLDLKDMSTFKASAQKGNYRVLMPRNLWSSFWAFMPNRNCKDAALRDLFNKKDWRIALSIGLNRKAISDALFYGLATPFPAICMPTMSFFKKEWATKYVEYDLAKANQLLDGLGLTKKDAEGYRLRPDGAGKLTIELSQAALGGTQLAVCEMAKSDWKKLGLDIVVKEYETSLYTTKQTANELQIATHNAGRSALFGRPNPLSFGFDDPANNRWAPMWTLWFSSSGKDGIEPPAEIKKQYDLMAQWRQTVVGTPEFDKIGAEYWTYFVEEIPIIGTVGLDPLPMVVNNKLRNVPEQDLWWSSDTNFYAPYWPTQWFFES